MPELTTTQWGILLVGFIIGIVVAIRISQFVEAWAKKKLFNNTSRDRRQNGRSTDAASNPGNSASAVALARIDVRLEGIVDKLAVFHRDFFAGRDKLIEAVQEVGKEVGKEISEGHDRLRKSVDANTVAVTKNTASVDVMKAKVERL